MDHACCFIVPPHIEARNKNRGAETTNGGLSDKLRQMRETSLLEPPMDVDRTSVNLQEEDDVQDIYTAKGTQRLPGWMVAKRQQDITDPCVRACWESTQDILKYYKDIVGFDLVHTLRGGQVISTLDVGDKYNNAFFNGRQMAYGQGDGRLFSDFCHDTSVICHELGHGVVNATVPLQYRNESGALNESYADVFAVCYAHYKSQRSFGKLRSSDWCIGERCVVGRGALRSFTETPARSPYHALGPDDEPRHYRDAYRGRDDNGGVHINSNIINHAFYKVCKALSNYPGGKTWEKPLTLWFDLLRHRKISRHCTFNDFTRALIAHAAESLNSTVVSKLVDAFAQVGLPH